MTVEQYQRPKGEAPNRHKSAEQVAEDEQRSRDVEEFLKSNKVTTGDPLYTKQEYKELPKAEKKRGTYATKTISWASPKR